jgi:hypothetical protein
MYLIMPIVFTTVHLLVLRKYGDNFVQYYKSCLVILNFIIILKCVQVYSGYFDFYEFDSENDSDEDDSTKYNIDSKGNRFLIFEQCFNYICMYISTDFIFYRVIFKMREIKLMEITPYSSYREFQRSMKL